MVEEKRDEYSKNPTKGLLVEIRSLEEDIDKEEVEANTLIRDTVLSKCILLEGYRWFSSTKEFMNLDFTTKGLEATEIYGFKGVKTSCTYRFGDKIAVVKTFNYKNTGVEIVFHYTNAEGIIVLEKKEFKPLNGVAIAKIEKANRDRTITYLQTTARDTPIEDFVNDLLKHYKTEVDLFIYNNTKDFENAIKNESNPLFLQYLGIKLENPSENYPEGKTVKDSILEQIL